MTSAASLSRNPPSLRYHFRLVYVNHEGGHKVTRAKETALVPVYQEPKFREGSQHAVEVEALTAHPESMGL